MMKVDRINLAAGLLCGVVGIMIAILPHLVSGLFFGSPQYLADGDELLYLDLERNPYQGEWTMRDPWTRPSDHTPTLYSWLQFVPSAKLAAVLGLPLLWIGLLWRIMGGFLFASSLYLLFRVLFHRLKQTVAWAVVCTMICLADGGLITGRLVVENVLNLYRLIHGNPLGVLGDSTSGQYRVVTPLTNLFIPILLAAVISATNFRGKRALGLGISLLGLCVYFYFYYWTAAFCALAAYIFVTIFLSWRIPAESGFYKREARFAALVLAGGLLLGLPQILSNAHTFAAPEYKIALERMSRGIHVIPGSAASTMYLYNRWYWFGLITATIGLALLRNRELIFPYLLMLSGFVLCNGALITGLEFENFHWNYIRGPFAEITVLALLGLALNGATSRNGARGLAVVGAGAVFLLASGGFLRAYQALHATEPTYYRQVLAGLKPLQVALGSVGRDDVMAGPAETNVAFLFTRGGQLYQFDRTGDSSALDDLEVHQRHALNGWLEGLDLSTYSLLATPQHYQAGAVSRPEWEPSHVRDQRVGIFKSLDGIEGGELLARYRPTHLLIPTAANRPTRGGDWQLVFQNSQWSLWSSKAAAASPR